MSPDKISVQNPSDPSINHLLSYGNLFKTWSFISDFSNEVYEWIRGLT